MVSLYESLKKQLSDLWEGYKNFFAERDDLKKRHPTVFYEAIEKCKNIDDLKDLNFDEWQKAEKPQIE